MAGRSEADVDMATEDMLDCVQITPEHIRANGTLHSSPFEGIAELVDNAVDSEAHTVSIERRVTYRRHEDGKSREYPYLLVRDDGSGMDRVEALKTILVGHSLKRGDVGMIGQFGNGLKSGSMRIGETMLLVTKKENEYTVLMISLKHLDKLKNHKCYAPCISYSEQSNKQLRPLRTKEERMEKHAIALNLILEYSPFRDENALHAFLKDALPGPSGTSIAVSDLKVLEDGKYELQVRGGDFIMENRQTEDGQSASLAEFLQQLYVDPRVVITLMGRQVRMLPPRFSLAAPHWMLLSKDRMDQFVKRERENVDKELSKLQEARVQVRLRVLELERQTSCVNTPYSKETAAELRRKQHELSEIDKQIKSISERYEGKNRPGADIRVYFGIDVRARNAPRIVFYSSGRRICTKPLEYKNRAAFHTMMGVVAIVDIPSTLLPTTQNRERFEIPSEFEFIVKKIIKHAKTYFEFVDPKYKTEEYWVKLGYDEEDCAEMDVCDPTHGAMLALKELPRILRQCARCREFKAVQFGDGDDSLLDTMEDTRWYCEKTRTENGEVNCLPKSRKEFAEDEIKELNTKGKATHYVSKKKREQEESRKSRKPTAKTPAKRGFSGRSRASSSERGSSSSPVARTRRTSAFNDSPVPRHRRNTPNYPLSEMSDRGSVRSASVRSASVRSSTKKTPKRRAAIQSSGSESDHEEEEEQQMDDWSQRGESPSTDSEGRRLMNRGGRSRSTTVEERDHSRASARGSAGPPSMNKSMRKSMLSNDSDGDEEPEGARGSRPRSSSRITSPLRMVTKASKTPLKPPPMLTVVKQEAKTPMNQTTRMSTSRKAADTEQPDSQSLPLFSNDQDDHVEHLAAIAKEEVGTDEDGDNSWITEVRVGGRANRISTGGMAPRKTANLSSIRTPPAAANAAEKRSADDERVAEIESKRRKTADAGKSLEVKEASDHGGHASLIAAAASAVASSFATVDRDDDLIARIYAGFPPVDNDGSIVGSMGDNDSILDGVPRSSYMSQARREEALRDKSDEEKNKLIIHLQDQHREVTTQLEKTKERLEERDERLEERDRKLEEKERQLEDMRKQLEETKERMEEKERQRARQVDDALAWGRKMESDVEAFFLLSNSDRNYVGGVVARAEDKAAALAAEMAALRRREDVDHEEVWVE